MLKLRNFFIFYGDNWKIFYLISNVKREHNLPLLSLISNVKLSILRIFLIDIYKYFLLLAEHKALRHMSSAFLTGSFHVLLVIVTDFLRIDTLRCTKGSTGIITNRLIMYSHVRNSFINCLCEETAKLTFSRINFFFIEEGSSIVSTIRNAHCGLYNFNALNYSIDVRSSIHNK